MIDKFGVLKNKGIDAPQVSFRAANSKSAALKVV
jgi:hypothetical protein